MPAWLCILTAALIYVFAVSPTAAVVLGRVIARRDRQVPTTPSQAAGRGRSDPRLRGAR